VPKKSLKEVIDVLKERVSPAPTVEPTRGFFNKSIVKKNCRQKEQSNSDLNLANKRIKQVGNVIIKKLNEIQKFGFIRCFFV
jgi:hypothetical protein